MSEENESPPPVTWDDVLRMYAKVTPPPPPAPKYVMIGQGAWDRMLAGASDDDRRTLEELREREFIISPHMPDGNVMWTIT